MQIEAEKEKRLNWDKDNARRKHNFMPMVVELLKQMATKGTLVSQVEKVLYSKTTNSSADALFRLKNGRKKRLKEEKS